MKEHFQNIYESFKVKNFIDFNISDFNEDIGKKLKQFDRVLLFRDLRESIVAFVLFILILLQLLLTDNGINTTIGNIILLFACILIPIVLYLSRKIRFDAITMPTTEYMASRRKLLTRQKRLLNSAFFWYMLPIDLGWMFIALDEEWDGAAILPMSRMVTQLLLYVAINVIVVWLNLKAAKSIQPYIDEVDAFLEEHQSTL
ncbi:hypothetical protein N9M27_03450 [Flavobacteriales bacterium]|nr:hypothetical protein [Flavobacteriales bacterium]